MTRTLSDIIKRIYENNIRNTKMRNTITDFEIKYKNAIAPYQDSISRCEAENKELSNTILHASMNDIIEGIAIKFNVKPEELEITYRSSNDYSLPDLTPAIASAKRFNNSTINNSRKINFIFNIKSANGANIRFCGTHFTTDSTEDGTELGEYIEAQALSVSDGAMLKINIKDFNKLLLTYHLGELLCETENGISPANSLAEIIIESAKKHEASQKKSKSL